MSEEPTVKTEFTYSYKYERFKVRIFTDGIWEVVSIEGNPGHEFLIQQGKLVV